MPPALYFITTLKKIWIRSKCCVCLCLKRNLNFSLEFVQISRDHCLAAIINFYLFVFAYYIKFIYVPTLMFGFF